MVYVIRPIAHQCSHFRPSLFYSARSNQLSPPVQRVLKQRLFKSAQQGQFSATCLYTVLAQVSAAALAHISEVCYAQCWLKAAQQTRSSSENNLQNDPAPS